MIKYQVRSKELIDVVNELTSGRLIKSPYFQRNLVWRLIHKVDFIKTILLGLPFPQIFIAKGEIDVETMTTHSCVVDGQQRLTAIQQFIANDFDVDGILFKDLKKREKEDFLKYQVPIIDLDIKKDDPTLKEIFRRLNRTFYALSNIERQSTEFAASDLMLISKVLTDELFFERDSSPESGGRELDPLIPAEIIKIAKSLNLSNFQNLVLDSGVFTNLEIARKVHLNFVLNVMATCVSGWYNRNSGVSRLLESDNPGFDKYAEFAEGLDDIAGFILRMKMKPTSYWLNKANIYSLIIVLYVNRNKLKTYKPGTLYDRLKDFESHITDEYAAAAKEAVNNKRERMLRHSKLQAVLFAA